MLPVYDIDRIVFASSLAIHIIIASITIGMPFAIGTLELYGILKKDESIKNLAQRISTLILVLFAIGTLSGTIVALEMYILFPKFMQIVSNTAIISLYIEIIAFFIESLFVGIYFYSFKKYNNSVLHPIFMYLIGIFGAMSGFLIITLNSFMNYPVGIEYLNGQYIDTNPYAIFFTPIQFIEVSHGVLASLEFGLSLFVLVISYKILKEKDIENIKIYGKALKLTIPILFLSILLLGIFGINSADTLSQYQPVKYSTLEANLNGNISNAPENLFGIVTNNYTLIDSIKIPNLQSLLLYGSFNSNTIVPGIYANESYIPSPNEITIAHNSFDIMAIFGFLIFFISLYGSISLIISKEYKKDKKFTLNPKYTFYMNKLLLYGLILLSILSLISLETGWIAAEVGRQPWTIYGILLTKDAANLNPGVVPIAIAFELIYIALFVLSIWAIKRYFINKL